MKPTIVVHGGAWNMPNEMRELHKKGVGEASFVGMDVLLSGGSALDAVEAAVNFMEDNPTFNAGRGSSLNAEGKVELDAIIMDGRTLNIGAVGAVKNIVTVHLFGKPGFSSLACR